MNSTSAINGYRIQEGREAKAFSRASLAESIGVTRAAISSFEKNVTSPNINTLCKISEKLELPLAYFRQDRPEVELRNSPISYRRRTRASISKQLQVERYEQWLSEIVAVFSHYIEFPSVNIAASNKLPEELDEDSIEQIAQDLRNSWGMGIGPISNLIGFMESNGCIIGYAPLPSDIDGSSDWRGERPYIILNSSKSSVRIRFSLAHELGHIVLHRYTDEIDFDNAHTHSLLENQANRFAQAFLFPARAYALEVPNLRFNYLIEVKKRWKVSMQAIVMRGKSLGLVTTDQVQYFYRQLSESGFSRSKEPLDYQFLPEKIELFTKALNMLLDNKIATLPILLDELMLSNSIFSSLSGIDVNENLEPNRKTIIRLNRSFFENAI